MGRSIAQDVLIYADHGRQEIGGCTLASDGWPFALHAIGERCGIKTVKPYTFDDSRREFLAVVPYRLRRGVASKHAKKLGYAKHALLR